MTILGETMRKEVIREKGITSIQVTLKTRDRLRNVGIKRETYDDLVNRLLDLEAGERQKASHKAEK
jgi:hypothetical protein